MTHITEGCIEDAVHYFSLLLLHVLLKTASCCSALCTVLRKHLLVITRHVIEKVTVYLCVHPLALFRGVAVDADRTVSDVPHGQLRMLF